MEVPIASVSTSAVLVIDAKKVVEIMPSIIDNTITNTVEMTSIKKDVDDIKNNKENIEIVILTKEQEDALNEVYDKAKTICDSIVNIVSLNNSVKITQIIGKVITLIEDLVKSGVKLSSIDKKIIAMELCRRIIKESPLDNKIKENILYKFNAIGDEMLETVIHISKNININIKNVQEVITPCCSSFMSFLPKNK